MLADTISVLNGNTFVVSDRRGDVNARATATHGLFHEDMRYLSQLELTLNGKTPSLLSTDDVAYYTAQFFMIQPTGSLVDDAEVSVIRRRTIGHGFTDSITILNHGTKSVSLQFRAEADADFADLFEIREQLSKTGELYQHAQADELVFGYRRGEYLRETRISSDRNDAFFEGNHLCFEIQLEPRGDWHVQVRVKIAIDMQSTISPTTPSAGVTRRPNSMGESLTEFVKQAPDVRSDWSTIEETYNRSLTDLAALRLPAYATTGSVVPAAGLPWFMCIFGRDSLITSYQTLPFVPDFARSTLRILALLQSQTFDDFRDAEPGKIMHELRSGELTAFEERPHSPYYGTADATPLFLVLLDEYERWTGDEALVHELQQPARAALEWIENSGDRDGDGFVEYQRRNITTGLENQCWKDSHDSIVFADGSESSLPRATCEIQGYVYDAKVRTARLARQFWGDDSLADRLEVEAAELKVRFNQEFWIPERDCFALALDGDKRQVDALTSNIGHLLWSGIADDDKAHACAGHLVGSALFSGWGIRTMASTEAPYSPVGYHTGTVWPHDNSLIAHGLARYGHHQEAALVALAIFQASTYFRNRLPEAFAGYSRDLTNFPVEFPTACSPQAWAAGAPLLLLRSLLGLEPLGFRLHMNPSLPEEIGRIDITGIRGRWGRANAFSQSSSVSPGSPPADGTIEQVFTTLSSQVGSGDLADISGPIQIDLQDGASWHLSVERGQLLVERAHKPADCVLTARGRDLLDVYRGKKTPNVVAMQGNIKVEGDVTLSLTWGALLAAAGTRSRLSTGAH
ncbi:MAG: amylo-alpha-1,6-glucosidase [Acidimicrobiales bacterium]|nr:amylo-alpha-1,6-glucosidase [Acidimicrobiales bacterium]